MKRWVNTAFLFAFMSGLYVGDDLQRETVKKAVKKAVKEIKESADKANNQKTTQSTPEVLCMAANIFAEARGEGEAGMRAVAAVVANRAFSPQYPNSVCAVVKQKYQFSWVNSNSTENQKLFKGDITGFNHKDYLAYQLAVTIANTPLVELTEGVPWGVMHYAHESVKNKWTERMQAVHKEGKHIFYRAVKNKSYD